MSKRRIATTVPLIFLAAAAALVALAKAIPIARAQTRGVLLQSPAAPDRDPSRDDLPCDRLPGSPGLPAPDDGPPPPPPPPGRDPLAAAIDTDADGRLSPDGIRHAATSLMSLDRNLDGKLSQDEYGPPPPPGRRDPVRVRPRPPFS